MIKFDSPIKKIDLIRPDYENKITDSKNYYFKFIPFAK
jgi:hypothetical protein